MTTVSALFEVEYGNKLDMNKMAPADPTAGIAFVGRKGGFGGHGGVSGYVEPIPDVPPNKPDLLTVALGGSRLLSTYVQQRPFYTAQNVAVLRPRDAAMPLVNRLFYAMCIRHNAFRYTAFGREANRTLGTIDLPSDVPLWAAGAAVPTVAGITKAADVPTKLSDPDHWTEYRLENYFQIEKGRRLTKADRALGSTNFIGASEKNNGITDLTSTPPLFKGGCLTVPYNGSVGWAFYQDEPFFASDDVNVLKPKAALSKWSLLFVATVIRHERTRYTYGYKWTLERMRARTIRLPAAPSGAPDWATMEAVMRGLPFSAAIA